ncbi:recombinase family protein [Ruegeria atlantica]|uniref:recombinase family protein n=1 Tax=Ruegeria atlantica TaxID=81569 RepID=UPI001F36AECB|nr:recombinase family protein [Ruegeria atlantica]
MSPRNIAANLNDEGIPGPRGTWGASTIYGNHQRGTGILNNELYIGRLVWNRQRFVKDPDTGKRQARLNPPEDWVIEDVPDLRIMSDDLWNAVKARQEETRSTAISDGIRKLGLTKRARHLFSGMLTCGGCGGGVIQVGKHYYGCSTHRNKGTCDNRLTIKRAELEDRVLSGLKEQLLHPDLIAEFTKAYQEEYNRLAGSIQQERSSATRDLAQIERKIAHLIDAISDGMFHASMKDKLTALEVRKSELEALIASASDEQPVLLHPGLSDVFREQVANLTKALRDPSSQAEATSIIRGLLSEIRLVLEDGTYTIELIGELAGLMALGAPQNEQSRPEAACSTVMVAGVGFEPTTFRL